MNIQDIIASLNKDFSFAKKENYSTDEVYALLEQISRKIGNHLDKEVTKTLSEKDATFNKLAAEKQELANSLEKVTNEKSKIAGDLEATQAKLAPLLTAQKHTTAKELFKGLVATGAEVDAWDFLGKNIEEFKFEDGADYAKKQEAVKPLVEKLFESRPYLKPAAVVAADNKDLVTDEKGKEKEEVEVLISSRPFGYVA